MEKEKFVALLSLITTALIEKIIQTYHLSEDDAICNLYRTEFYKYLENEKTKFWHYSIEKMFDIYQTEIETGRLEVPEY